MDDLLTVRQIAILLKVHPLTIRRYINEGKLKALKVAGNIRIQHQEVLNFSQGYIPHDKGIKTSQAAEKDPFHPDDSLFRMRGRGLSIDNLNR